VQVLEEVLDAARYVLGAPVQVLQRDGVPQPSCRLGALDAGEPDVDGAQEVAAERQQIGWRLQQALERLQHLAVRPALEGEDLPDFLGCLQWGLLSSGECTR